MNHRSNDIERRDGGTNGARSSNNDRSHQITVPRSLLRDRPLAEPRLHQHTPLVAMNRTQQQRPPITSSQRIPNITNESTTSPSHPVMPVHRSLDGRPSPPTPSPSSDKSASFLPSIDESNSQKAFRYDKDGYFYEKKLKNADNNHHGSSISSLTMEALDRVPLLSSSSDNSSLDSYMEASSSHSSSSSDNSTDYDYENENDYDKDLSASIRSTQSLPPIRRRSDHSRRSYRSQHQQQPPKQHFNRARSHSSYSSLPSPSQQQIDPSSMSRISTPPFPKQARRQSFSGSMPSYQKSTKSRSSPSTESSRCMNRRQCMVNFLVSGVCLQLLLLLGIALLVVWSRSQAALATDTLLRLRESESMGLLRLHRLESHSMHVHELIRNRLERQNNKNADTDDLEDLLEGEEAGDLDTQGDPLIAQYEHLAQMSSDLRKHAAVTSLQSTIQETAIEEIVDTYGEGPVKVVIELDFGDQPLIASNNRKARRTHEMVKGTYISIALWPDTPHAAWAWLEQIGRRIWDGSSVEWDSTSTLLQFKPTKDDPMDRGHLEFVEGHPSQEKSNPDMHHGAWTIGMREILGDENNKGSSRLEMFINLADNREERKHETCIGKIFDGFDALQRLLEGTEVTEDGEAVTNVSVRSVTAAHITHQELEQIYR